MSGKLSGVAIAACLALGAGTPLAQGNPDQAASVLDWTNTGPGTPDNISQSREWGTTNWILSWLPAASFQPYESTIGWAYDGSGYIHPTGAGPAWFYAAVDLPNGALLDVARLYFCDSTAGGGFQMYFAYYDGGRATAPGFTQISNETTTGTGCTTYALASGVLNHTIDTSGVSNDRQYVLWVKPSTSTNSTRFKGVRLAWHRQISPAPATASFSDVPTTAQFFREIEALRSSGITTGCGGGKFCPTDNVTRGQMAAFLARAFGLDFHW